jgi:hypothetical protein
MLLRLVHPRSERGNERVGCSAEQSGAYLRVESRGGVVGDAADYGVIGDVRGDVEGSVLDVEQGDRSAVGVEQ